MKPDTERLLLEYDKLQKELKQWYQKSCECDEEYTKNFPGDNKHEEEAHYNNEYQKKRVKLETERKSIFEKMDKIEIEIQKEFPAFTPRKHMNSN